MPGRLDRVQLSRVNGESHFRKGKVDLGSGRWIPAILLQDETCFHQGIDLEVTVDLQLDGVLMVKHHRTASLVPFESENLP